MTKVIETNQNNNSYDYSISLVRCVATIFIVTCHIMQWADMELAWWFNVGVQIFFCMSGYLYANKKIESSVDFYKKTFRKILIDYWVVLVLVLPIYFVFRRDLISVPCIVKIFLTSGIIYGGDHLWFIPYILLCYFITPFLNEFMVRNAKRRGVKLILWCAIILLLNAYIFIEFFSRFTSAWIACYIIGMAIGRFEEDNKNGYRLIVFAVVALALVLNIIQIFTNYTHIDLYNILTLGKLPALYWVFCEYAHACLGVTLFVVLRKIFIGLLKIEQINELLVRIARLSDQYSYDVYLVHSWIILGPFSLMAITGFPFINILLIVVLIVVMAICVKYLSRIINRAIDKKLSNQGV